MDLLNAKYFVTNTYNESYETLAKRPERFSLVFSEGAVRVFENRLALPRAFFVPVSAHALKILSDEEAQLARLKDPGFDPEREVILPDMPSMLADLAGEGPQSTASAQVAWIHTSLNRMDLTVTTNKPGVLVLSQIFYPGWQVLVDEHEAPILRTDYALTGVALREGIRNVSFIYRPMSFRIGSAVSAGAVSILIVVLVIGRRRKWMVSRASTG